MAGTGRGVDFVTIDGGEGGTGAAPLIFTDSVSLPFQLGLRPGLQAFAEHGLHEQVTFIGAGKLGLPDNAVVAFALGCDMVNVGAGGDARDRLHPGPEVPHRHLPHRGGHPERLADQRAGPRAEVGPGRQLHQDAAPRPDEGGRGVRRRAPRPDRPRPVEMLDGRTASTPLREVYGYEPGWGLPSAADRAKIIRIMSGEAPQGASAEPSDTATG